jgi:hypothetical protein
MDDHIEPRAVSDEALVEMSRAIEKALGLPGDPVIGVAAASVVTDYESGELKVAGSLWGLTDEHTPEVARVVRDWLDRSAS